MWRVEIIVPYVYTVGSMRLWVRQTRVVSHLLLKCSLLCGDVLHLLYSNCTRSMEGGKLLWLKLLSES